VFKNVEFDANENMGDCIRELYTKEEKAKPKMTRKLISSYFGKKLSLSRIELDG
jgi:hypothetical protein